MFKREPQLQRIRPMTMTDAVLRDYHGWSHRQAERARSVETLALLAARLDAIERAQVEAKTAGLRAMLHLRKRGLASRIASLSRELWLCESLPHAANQNESGGGSQPPAAQRVAA